ncbi:galactonate dehydratase [Paenibacillus sp. MWE-103]|uniref:Galactonate dehydratase n=1 Tax=Paenibacillus artemisiicola TaxID=1172618 RepID=A0ABS3W5E2_9BACL|nr:galactonate dehydratase [Paenibacillus artemisiicola]MBO7743529.1 galactonate dehydratase [Paenibacillus artemisiicola]
MKITNVIAILSGEGVFVKVETDEDIAGYGEGTSFTPRAVIGMIEELKPYLIGEDATRIEHLWQMCFRTLFARGGPVTGSAIAAIDIALWDIKGKALGVPVYQLLGGLARDKVRVYGPVAGKTAEEIAGKAKKLADRGVTAIRYRAFHDWDALHLHDHKRAVMQQVEYTEAIRAAVGEDVDLILECHGRYDPDYAVMLAKIVEKYRPLYLEDPIRHENPQAYRRLRPFTSIPLATGERSHNKFEFRELVESGLVDYLRPDVCWCGGITEMRKIAAMAETHYINLVPHNNWGPVGTAASMHVSLAFSNVALLELPASASDPKDLNTDVASPYPVVENGYALPLLGPGLGVEFSEAAALARPPKPGTTPKLKALDGSVRDW